MDLKNVIFAIALSFAVLFGWSVIFETPQIEEQKKLEQSKSSPNSESDNSDVPSVSVEKEKVVNISRDELQALCDELDRVYNLMREDYDNANYDLLRVKMLGFWRELKFYLDSLDTL